MEYAHIDSCNLHVWLKLHSWFTGVAAMPPRKKQKARTKQKDKARGVAAMPPRKKQKARTKQKDKARAKPLDPLMKRPASKRPASPELDDGNVPLMNLKMKRPASNPRSGSPPGTLKPDDGSLVDLGDAYCLSEKCKMVRTLQDEIDDFVVRKETKHVKARWEAQHASGWYLLEPDPQLQEELSQVYAASRSGGRTTVEYQWPSGSGFLFVLDLVKFTKKNMITGVEENLRYIIS